eukprot:8421377-Karenia_brevis.AAC.1
MMSEASSSVLGDITNKRSAWNGTGETPQGKSPKREDAPFDTAQSKWIQDALAHSTHAAIGAFSGKCAERFHAVECRQTSLEQENRQ